MGRIGWIIVWALGCSDPPKQAPEPPPSGRCGAELPPSPFTKPGSTRVVVADFYGLGPDDAPLVLKVTEQVDDVLRRFREETVPGMKGEVTLEDIEFGRLPCFVKSHEEAERVAKAWEADLVLWGKAYCTQEDLAVPKVTVDQAVEVGNIRAVGEARVNAGVVEVHGPTTEKEGAPEVRVRQQVQAGDITARDESRVTVGKVQVDVQVPATEVICPSATLHHRDIGLRRTDELPGLEKMELPVLSTSKPGSLLAFTLGLHFHERDEPWKAARFYELAAGDVLAEGGGRGMDVLHLKLGYAYQHIEGGQEKSLAHSRAALRFHEGRGTWEEARLLNNIGSALLDQGKVTEAETYARHALEITERTVGASHLTMATKLNNLGMVLRTQGKTEEAERLFRRALAIEEGALGPGDLDTAVELSNLGGALLAQGKAAEAEGLYRHAFAIDESARGPNHPDMARGLNNIGSALLAQGKAAEAESFYRRALAVAEKALGPDHPHTATALNNIGSALEDQGKAAEAEDLYRRALAITEKALGPNHPDTAIRLSNIGSALKAQDNATEAEGFFRRALAIDEKALGPDHPSKASDLNNIGSALQDQGKAAEAEGFYRRALAIDERTLGPNHPNTAMDKSNIGSALHDQGKVQLAEVFYRQALAIDEKALGLEHPNTARDLSNIGSALQDQRKVNEAEAFYRRAFELRLAHLGKEHPKTQAVLASLLTVRATLAGRKGDEGALVLSTQPGGQAEAIGLQPGDLIRRYGKTKLRNMKHLVELTGQSSPEASIVLEVVRGKQVLRLSVRGGRLGAVVR